MPKIPPSAAEKRAASLAEKADAIKYWSATELLYYAASNKLPKATAKEHLTNLLGPDPATALLEGTPDAKREAIKLLFE
jgi:hypothetical protein